MWNVTQPESTVQQIGKHDAPVRCLKSVPEINMVATGSWDKTVRLWDSRSPTAAAQVQLEERVYAMDVGHPAIVIGTADRNFHVYDMTAGLSKSLAKYVSPMTYQTRCISVFNDKKGFAAGCIEGRCAIENFDEMGKKVQNSKNFVFKCHRIKQLPKDQASPSEIYGVNAISFTNQNTFVTGGSDGNMIIWDKIGKSRLTALDMYEKKSTVSALTFNPMSNLLFYALSYDWSMGQHGFLSNTPNKIYIHQISPTEITPKKR